MQEGDTDDPEQHPIASALWRERVQRRAPAMMAYVVSEGRVFALKPSEWGMLLTGVALCGFGVLLF